MRLKVDDPAGGAGHVEQAADVALITGDDIGSQFGRKLSDRGVHDIT